MESKKNLPNERDKTLGSTPESSHTPGQTHPTGGQTSTAPQRAREAANEVSNSAQQVYDQTRHAVSNAYEKTSETLSNTYDQAMSYGREHPGQLTLIAFGAGIGVGILLASGLSGGRSRSNRIIEPVGNALTQIAMELFRR